jgi:hypothetical protein
MAVVAANLAAGFTVGGYLLRSHRALFRTVREMRADRL